MSAEWTSRIMRACEKQDIPRHMAESLAAYATTGRPVGGFLAALLSNDLMEAIGKADDTNVCLLKGYAIVLYNDMPGGCFRSPERVQEWQKMGGLSGMAQS